MSTIDVETDATRKPVISTIDVEADARPRPVLQTDTDPRPRSPVQTLEKFVSIDGYGGKDALAADYASIAIGPGAKASYTAETGKIAIGWNVSANRLASVAIGQESASEYVGTAVGYQAWAKGDVSAAFGRATAEGNRSVAIGSQSWAKANYSVTLGTLSIADAKHAVAMGPWSNAGHENAVALGSNSKTDQDNTISVGSVEFRRAIRFVRDAELSSASHEAVTGRQLYATNQKVDANETAIAGNTQNIDRTTNQLRDLREEVSNGSLGLVQQNGSNRKLTIGAAADGTLIDAAGIQGARRLSGLADGQDSADAVTYRQLDALRNDRLLARYDDGAREQLTFNLGGKPTRLGNVSNGKERNDAVNIGQLDDRVQPLTGEIQSLQNQQQDQGDVLAALQALAVQYADSGLSSIALAGESGTILSNVADGVNPKDAVNKGQLNVLNALVKQLAIDQGTMVNDVRNLELYAVQHEADGDHNISAGSKITDLENGTDPADAVNMRQLEGVVTTLDKRLLDVVTYSNPDHTQLTLNAGATPARLSNIADGTDRLDAVNFSQVEPMLAKQRFLSVSGMTDAEAAGKEAIALGGGASAAKEYGVALGSKAVAAGSYDVAVGRSASAAAEVTSDNYYYTGIAVGYNSQSQSSGIAVGQAAVAAMRGAVAIGTSSKVAARYSVCIGQQAISAAEAAVALGKRAACSEEAEEAVALGSDSIADVARTVSVGNSKIKRRLVNVGEGTDLDDAVTVRQLIPLRLAQERLERDAETRYQELRHGDEARYQQLEQKCSVLESALQSCEQRHGALEALIRDLSARLEVR